MSRVYSFADEAGNFDFRDKPGASKYFVLGTVTLKDGTLAEELLRLRRDLAWQGVGLESSFHASEDQQAVRDAVFGVIQKADFRFDTTVLEKRKTQAHLQANHARFYKMAWYLHFKYVCPRIVKKQDELLVIAAQIGTKKSRKSVRAAIADVVAQCAPCSTWEVAFWPAESDPCLQVADYCTWAVQRKYENGDSRSYDLIKTKIGSEFEPFKSGPNQY